MPTHPRWCDVRHRRYWEVIRDPHLSDLYDRFRLSRAFRWLREPDGGEAERRAGIERLLADARRRA